jgi:nuclear pore complex protein Nup160
MADRPACHLFKQTRINLDWTESTATSMIDVSLPLHASRIHRGLNIRRKVKRQEQPDTEEKFKLANHATSASIYFRPSTRFPRCILWRILGDFEVLCITAVDFTKPESHAELETTFRFIFPEPVQPATIGFADAPGRDELIVYALTQGGIFYTLNLTPDFLLHKSVLRRGSKTSDFCATYYPSAFVLHTPHFLLPLDHESLIIPLQDGNILKLEKNYKACQDSEPLLVSKHYNFTDIGAVSDPSITSYAEKTFSDSSYFGFIKNKMPWVGSGTVQYGQSTVTHTTVVSAIAHNPSPRPGKSPNHDRPTTDPLLFTVSVDHSLKVWSLKRESLLRVTDLFNEPQSAAVKMKTWLDPSPSHLLTIIDDSFQEDHSFYLVSFSSASTGKFKFWAATHYENGQFKDLVDLYPNDMFEARPPGATAPWIISEFRVTSVTSENPSVYDLWVLWKSDTNFQIQNVRFDIKDVKSWWDQWTTATSDTVHILPRRMVSRESSENVADHWMDWVFYPGRFPETVLESALLIYANNFLMRLPPGSPTETLQAKVARVVSSAVETHKDSMGSLDFEKYRNEIDLQWDRFSRLCMELDKERREALSLVSDPVSGLVWTVNVDGITALRGCTETEAMWHNFSTPDRNLEMLSSRMSKRLGAGLCDKGLSDAMLLIYAANELNESLSEITLNKCIAHLQEEVVKDEMLSISDLMWALYENCLDQEVPSDTYDKIESLFQSIKDPQIAFQSVMSSLFHAEIHAGSTRLTSFGVKVLVGGTQEVIHVNHELVFQLVFLLIYVTFAEDNQTFRISQPEELYHQLVNYFREYEILSWMAQNSASLPAPPQSSDDEISSALVDLRVSGENSSIGKMGSVLQLVLKDNFGPPLPSSGRPGSVSISACIRQFLAGLELSDNGDGVTNVVQALLGAGSAESATSFSKFLPSTFWGTYMAARILLTAHQYAAAVSRFNNAAYGMCKFYLSLFFPPDYLTSPSATASSATAAATNILLPESGAVGSGLARYFLHIATLFDEANAPEYVVDICNAGLMAANNSVGTGVIFDSIR